MIRKYVMTCLIMIVVSTSGIAFANDIYKWTDEDGNVHYGDRPTGDATEERMAISSTSTDPSKVQARAQSRYAPKDPAEEAVANEPQGPTEEDLHLQAAQRKEKCDTYKARLQKFVQSRRLYKQDENGDRVYLDEDQTQAARERVENQVQEYCHS
jgi:hypothetical protein